MATKLTPADLGTVRTAREIASRFGYPIDELDDRAVLRGVQRLLETIAAKRGR